MRKGKFRGQGAFAGCAAAHGRSLHSFILSPAGDIKRKHAAEIFFSPTCWVCSSCPVVWCLLLGPSSRPAGGDCRRARNSRGLEQSAVDFLPAFLHHGRYTNSERSRALGSNRSPASPCASRPPPRSSMPSPADRAFVGPSDHKQKAPEPIESQREPVCLWKYSGKRDLVWNPNHRQRDGVPPAQWRRRFTPSNTTCSEVTEIFKLPHRLDFSQRADRRQHQRQRWMPLRRRRLCDVFRRYQRPSNGERRAGRRSRGNQQHHRGQHAAVRHPGGRIAGLFFDFEQWYLRRGLRDPGFAVGLELRAFNAVQGCGARSPEGSRIKSTTELAHGCQEYFWMANSHTCGKGSKRFRSESFSIRINVTWSKTIEPLTTHQSRPRKSRILNPRSGTRRSSKPEP